VFGILSPEPGFATMQKLMNKAFEFLSTACKKKE
jgi:hypothetical protein